MCIHHCGNWCSCVYVPGIPCPQHQRNTHCFGAVKKSPRCLERIINYLSLISTQVTNSSNDAWHLFSAKTLFKPMIAEWILFHNRYSLPLASPVAHPHLHARNSKNNRKDKYAWDHMNVYDGVCICISFHVYAFCCSWPIWSTCINSLWPSNTIWWYKSTLAQVMDCCLTASSHYLNQCWLIISNLLIEVYICILQGL